jgi:hypothetical protein
MNKNDLKELNGLFNQVKDKDESEFSNYTQIPDGNYKAIIDDLEITESKAGKPMFVISYKIMEGEFKDQIHKQFIMLCGNDETQLSRNLNRYATTVKKLGIDTEQGIEYTFNHLGVGLNKEVIVKVETSVAKNGNSYTNTSFDLI